MKNNFTCRHIFKTLLQQKKITSILKIEINIIQKSYDSIALTPNWQFAYVFQGGTRAKLVTSVVKPKTSIIHGKTFSLQWAKAQLLKIYAMGTHVHGFKEVFISQYFHLNYTSPDSPHPDVPRHHGVGSSGKPGNWWELQQKSWKASMGKRRKAVWNQKLSLGGLPPPSQPMQRSSAAVRWKMARLSQKSYSEIGNTFPDIRLCVRHGK